MNINKLNFSDNLKNANEILSNAQSNITFWGKRVVTVDGYQGSIALDTLVKKFLEEGSRHSPELNAVIKILSNATKKHVMTITKEGKKPLLLDVIARQYLIPNLPARCSKNVLETEERVAGLEILNKLRNIYSVTDTQIDQKSWFTRLLNKIREFTIYPYSTRFLIEDDLLEKYFKEWSGASKLT